MDALNVSPDSTFTMKIREKLTISKPLTRDCSYQTFLSSKQDLVMKTPPFAGLPGS